MQEQVPIPVTLLTGFLGAGKTTLINGFLKAHSSHPIAIIENEFGPVNIDGLFINRDSNVNIIELTNGCVCCTVRGEFTQAVLDLFYKKSRGEIEFNRIIVELTGLADPSPVAQGFFIDDKLRSEFILDGCIAIVDSIHIMQQLDAHAVAAAQIGFADRILLTKTDQVQRESLGFIKERLKRINANADILEVVNGVCDSGNWININGFQLSDDLKYEQPNRKVKSKLSIDNKKSSFMRNFGTAQPVADSVWQDKIQSVLLEAGTIDLNKLGTWIEDLVDQYGNDMLRYKGVFSICDDERKLIVQGVHKIVGYDFGFNWHQQEVRNSQLVIIGRNLPIEELKESFLNTQP